MFINFGNHLIPIANIAYMQKGQQFKDFEIISGKKPAPESPLPEDFIYSVVVYFIKDLLIDPEYQKGMVVKAFDTLMERDDYWDDLAGQL